MARHRSIRYNPHYSFNTVAEFLKKNRPDSGTYSIRCGEHKHYIDLQTQNRNSSTTIVTFNGALSANTKYLPNFAGNRMSQEAGLNLIAIADPALAIEAGQLDIAWHLGDKFTGPLRVVLSPLIRHLVNSMKTKRLILFGPSGGGYSALNFAQDFPNSIVLIVNPRLSMTSRPHPGHTLEQYLKVAHGATSSEQLETLHRQYVIDDLASIYEGSRLPFELLIAQNQGDQRFLNGQVKPFYEKFKNDKRFHIRFDNYSNSHTPIPRHVLDRILKPLAERGSKRKRIVSAGFHRASKIKFPTT